MKHAQACLSAREHRESSFDHCGVTETRGSLFMFGKDLITPFQPPRRCCEARAGLFKCQGRSRKQFSSL